MGFAENVRQVRKEKGLSQEELAELLAVSRQAVSKWEQGGGYPEVETLLLMSNKLNVSLDSLFAVETAGAGSAGNAGVAGTIIITSPNENVIVPCYKVTSSQKMPGGKRSPQYALFGVSGGASFWGEPTTFLGWYATKDAVEKEIAAIRSALLRGSASYTLQYSVKVERRWLGVKIAEE